MVLDEGLEDTTESISGDRFDLYLVLVQRQHECDVSRDFLPIFFRNRRFLEIQLDLGRRGSLLRREGLLEGRGRDLPSSGFHVGVNDIGGLSGQTFDGENDRAFATVELESVLGFGGVDRIGTSRHHFSIWRLRRPLQRQHVVDLDRLIRNQCKRR